MSRTYGGNGTIHSTKHLDVELGPDGTVIAVWFRCQMLPFVEHRVDESRAKLLDYFLDSTLKLLSVELQED